MVQAERPASRHGYVEVEPGLRVRYDEMGDGPQTLIVLNELTDMAPLAAKRRIVDRCEWPNEWPAYAWRLGRHVQSTLFDIRDQLSAITARTVIFHGDRDFLPLAGSETWAARVPRARLVRVSDAGHYLPVERPDLFFPVVDEWLRVGGVSGS